MHRGLLYCCARAPRFEPFKYSRYDVHVRVAVRDFDRSRRRLLQLSWKSAKASTSSSSCSSDRLVQRVPESTGSRRCGSWCQEDGCCAFRLTQGIVLPRRSPQDTYDPFVAVASKGLKVFKEKAKDERKGEHDASGEPKSKATETPASNDEGEAGECKPAEGDTSNQPAAEPGVTGGPAKEGEGAMDVAGGKPQDVAACPAEDSPSKDKEEAPISSTFNDDDGQSQPEESKGAEPPAASLEGNDATTAPAAVEPMSQEDCGSLDEVVGSTGEGLSVSGPEAK